MPDVTATHAHRHGLSYWFRILVVSTVGAVVAFGLLGGFVTNAPWSFRWRTLATSLIYANSIGATCGLLLPPILHRIGHGTAAARWVARLVVIPLVVVVGCALASVIGVALGFIRWNQYIATVSGSLWISLLVGCLASLAVVAYETLRGQLDQTTKALQSKEIEEADARRAAAEAQLASLESRVNPHFLFNTLNSIAALTHSDPAGAERMTSQLASLMRSSLDSGSRSLVTVDEELHLVRNYLEIEAVRVGDRLRFVIEADESVRQARIPRLSLQTIVENSVKFAVSPRREGASIIIRAKAANTSVHLEIEDDGPGFDAEELPEGHGLALLRSRLAMTFGDAARLVIDSRPGHSVVAIEVPRSG